MCENGTYEGSEGIDEQPCPLSPNELDVVRRLTALEGKVRELESSLNPEHRLEAKGLRQEYIDPIRKGFIAGGVAVGVKKLLDKAESIISKLMGSG